MTHLAVRDLKPGDVFIRQDRDAARVITIEKNTRVLKVEKVEWEIKTATGYAPTDNPKKTSISIDETNRFLLKVEIFGWDGVWRPYVGEMNLHRDHVVLVVERA